MVFHYRQGNGFGLEQGSKLKLRHLYKITVLEGYSSWKGRPEENQVKLKLNCFNVGPDGI
jgi:hypothetical protein